MTQWPLQRECDSFYGNPRGRNGQASSKWESENLVYCIPSFPIFYEKTPVKKFKVHKKCLTAFTNVFNNLLSAANNDYEKLKYWGVTKYAGCYVFRMMRGGYSLSMHSYGIAIDFDPDNNGFGDPTPRFKQFPEVLKAFADEGATWGGNWRKADGMHWQFARVA